MTTVSRKFFSEICSLPSITPTRVGTMMATSGWGFTPGADNAIGTQPSMDSTIGTGLAIIPTATTIYVGHDEFVRDAAGVGPPRTYAGIPVAAGERFNVEEFARGLVDIFEVWLYTPGGAQNIQIVFKGI